MRRPDRRADRRAQGRGPEPGLCRQSDPISGTERCRDRAGDALGRSQGVTGVADVSVPWFEVDAFSGRTHAGRLTTRVAVYVPLQDWRRMADTVQAKGVGDDWLRVGGRQGLRGRVARLPHRPVLPAVQR